MSRYERANLVAVFLGAMVLALTCYAQYGAVLTADTNRVSTSTFVLGEKVATKFSIGGLRPLEKFTLVVDVRDEFGKPVVGQTPIMLTANEKGALSYTLSVPASKYGYYEVRAWLSDGTRLSGEGTRPSGFISYAVVPDPAKRKDYGDIGSRFGLQGGFSSAAPVIPYLGVRYVLARYDWARLEPEKIGQFSVDSHEASFKGITPSSRYSEGGDLLYRGAPWNTYKISIVTSASIPAWALRPGTGGAICKSFGGLSEVGKRALPHFARAQAEAFSKDHREQRSRYYQITWEPASDWCFRGVAQDLVEFYSASYTAIHQGDPRAIVAGPTLFIDQDSTRQLEGLWTAGLGKYIDAISLHPYVHHWPPEKDGLPGILHDQLAAATKAVGHPIPFIGTEHGFGSVAEGNLNKALGDVRTTLIMLGEGAAFDFGFYVADFLEGESPAKDKGYGFYWNLNTRINWGTDKVGPKIIVPAYAAMTYFLDGAKSIGPLSRLKGSQVGYAFVRGQTRIEAVWDYAKDSELEISPNTTVCDWMGNCAQSSTRVAMIGAAPTYLQIK